MPAPGPNLPPKAARMLEDVYQSARRAGDSAALASRKAWGTVKRFYYRQGEHWRKRKQPLPEGTKMAKRKTAKRKTTKRKTTKRRTTKRRALGGKKTAKRRTTRRRKSAKREPSQKVQTKNLNAALRQAV